MATVGPGLHRAAAIGVLAASLVNSPALFAQAAQAAPMIREAAVRKLTTHVWAIPGNGAPMVPNVGIIVGTRATLVVNPGMGVRNGQAVLRAAARLGKNTEMYVVTTDFFPNVSSGVSGFPASAKYIISQAQQRDLAELAPAASADLAKRNAAMAALLKDAVPRKADISFDKTYELDLGGVKATLMALGPAHARGDTAVWVQDGMDGVIFSGEVALNREIVDYGQYSSTKVWMDSLAQLVQLRPANDDEPPVVVPSHGPITDANIFAYERGFFQAVQARVRDLKQQGKTEPEIFASVTDEMKDRYAKWGGVDRIGAVVANVYQEMR